MYLECSEQLFLMYGAGCLTTFAILGITALIIWLLGRKKQNVMEEDN